MRGIKDGITVKATTSLDITAFSCTGFNQCKRKPLCLLLVVMMSLWHFLLDMASHCVLAYYSKWSRSILWMQGLQMYPVLNFASSSCLSPDDWVISHIAVSQSNGITCCVPVLPSKWRSLLLRCAPQVQQNSVALLHSVRDRIMALNYRNLLCKRPG